MERRQTQTGFTLIELVTVITILGLLAVAVVPRFATTSNFETRSVEDQLISTYRQAQQLALSKPINAQVRVVTDSANNQIRIENDIGDPPVVIPIAENVGLTVSTIAFTKKGDANIAGQQTISISPGSRNVCVETTGYAHAC